MAISKGFRYKDKEGKVTDYEYGVNGSNVTQDSEHRLVTDEEKQTWNDKADLEDIPSGSAASHAVANNCTTTQAGSVLDARQGKVLMDKANQLSSETEKLNIRCQRYVDYSDRGLASAIDFTFDLVVAELGNGFFSRVIETNEGYFALYGYLSVNMTGIATQIGADNTYMFYKNAGGADAVLKKLGSNIVYIGNSTSIDVKTVLPNDYANLTADNFIVELASLSANGGAANTGGASYPQFGSVNANSNMTKTYNNGVLTIQGIACSGETYNGDRTWRRYVSASAGIRVYAVY